MKTRFLFITALIFLITNNLFSQFTKQQAIDTVLNHIIVADTGQVNVFVSNSTYSSSDTLWLEYFNNVTFTYPQSWVFFIDDNPMVNWHHPCRYILVNSTNGEYDVVLHSIYPIDIETDFEMVQQMKFTHYVNFNPIEGAISGKNPDPVAPNPNLYAVLITGSNDTKEFWDDISNMYCTLIEGYGYEKENIFVHYVNEETNTQLGQDLDGGLYSDDIDYSSHIDTLKRTFLNLGGVAGPLYDPTIPELDEEDQLFVFINGHGGYYSIPNNDGSYLQIMGTSGWDNKLYDTEFASWLQHIKCAQMFFTMEPCYSGGFIDDILDYVNYQVQCDNREIHTACEYEPSAPEWWVTLGDDPPAMSNFRFGEFVFYWTAAVRGYYPDFDEPWNVWIDYPVGFFPLDEYFPEELEHPGDHDPDLNGDGIIQIGEAFEYADFFDTYSPNGFYAIHPDYPDPNFEEHPDKEKIFGFQEDLLTLHGISGEVSNSQSVQGNYAIGGPISFAHSPTLTLLPNSNLYFINDFVTINGEEVEVNFTVPGNCNLILQNDVTFYGYDDPNSIDVYGYIEFGPNNRFLSLSGNTWEGMNLLNEDANIVIDGATFEKCGISGNPEYLNLDNLDFSNGFIDLETTNVDLDNSEFYHSNFKDIFGDRTSFVNINNCSFDHSWTDGIYINNFYSYQIQNCTINNCLDGIKIFNSGSSGTASIYQNLINDNIDDGIEIYNSHAYLNLNNIRDNDGDGIALHDNSFVRLYGNKGAHFVSETQRLRDNGKYELFTDEGSFPEKFRWNAIIDEDNELDGFELVYCETTVSNEKDVRYNFWGSEENFHPVHDFYPSEDYTYLPLFFLEDDEEETSSEEMLYNSAEDNFAQGNFMVSQSEYKQVIEQYPDSKFAKASIKQLFAVEEFASNDHFALKEYYRSNSTILNNMELEKLADFFANKCDIKLENWQLAIDWFENQIQNPASYADSLYAVIDLGNTYVLMQQSGYKSYYSGTLTEHIPTSQQQFEEKRDYILSLIPGDKEDKTLPENIIDLGAGELMQNIPNPVKSFTKIWYKLENEASVQLIVHNYIGQLVSTFNCGTKSEGMHHIDFNVNGLKNGIYFYSLRINGQNTDSKKMTIMK